ncbi:MAG TPA: 4-alpha-glucanotransferase [Acidimicrobiales bacterium]|nr:4-alpha-glucanotransferase [Acidimicrobiales bacterium]
MADDRVVTHYRDAFGADRPSPSWAVDRVRAILAEPHRRSGFVDVVRVRAGEGSGPLAGRPLELEDGGTVELGGAIPDDLPLGYHRVEGDDGPILVLHAPGQVPGPGARPGWVVVAQLYASRSRDSWGHGDLRDARHVVEWVRAGGPGGHVMVNPLHAPTPGADPQPSPYFASSRVFRNPLYLAVEELPGAHGVDVSTPRDAAVALNDDRLLDRPRAWAAKRAALAKIWDEQRRDPGVVARVDRWLADPVQRRYAAWCVATEAALSPPPAADVSLSSAPTDEERFHAWLQVELEDQLHQVGDVLIHDVAVGVERGADTWLWPDCYVLDGTRIGAPPDAFNTQGQDWGLPPYHPAGLRAAGYEPFVRAVRSSLWGAAGIRIDHIMGLERLYWIPADGAPDEGVYVQYDLEEMLDILAIEAHRADAFVVGEDLGTVPPAIREAMARRGLLSYRVMALSADDPAHYPDRSMAAITTHDLPTIQGLLTGRDLAAQQDLGLEPNVDGTNEAVARLRHWVGADGDTALSDEEVAVRLHDVLSRSSAHLVAATLEDLALMSERPNMPGTIDTWPNWCWSLPQPLEDVLASATATRVRAVLAERVER